MALRHSVGQKVQPSGGRSKLAKLLLSLVASITLATFGAGLAVTVAVVATNGPATNIPSGNNGTTIDPLQYNCGNDSPTCGQVGESNGYYNGTNVDLLYSEDYYCDAIGPSTTRHRL